MKSIGEDQVAKFMARIKPGPVPSCWEWAGNISVHGYGTFWCKLENDKICKLRSAHRISFLIKHGKLTDGLVIDHLCRNRSCVNPDHLREVTSRANTLENSIGLALNNLNKTHCLNGHEFSKGNTFTVKTKNGQAHRRCRECSRIGASKTRSMKKLIFEMIDIQKNRDTYPVDLKDKWITRAMALIEGI